MTVDRAHEVVVAGGGPVGTMLAAELALAGVDVGLLERRPDRELVGGRAGGFHARTLEVLDQRGIVDRFLAEGRKVQAITVGSTVIDMGDAPTRHPYTLAIGQERVERILADWADELGVAVHRGAEVTGLTQDDDGVAVALADGSVVRGRYLVGCDGGRSTVRRAAGIDFPGWDATRSNLIAEVEVTEQPPAGPRHDAHGVHGLHPMEDGRRYRVVLTEPEVRHGADPSLDELRAGLVAVFGTDFGVHHPTWISRFSDATRQAATYRSGRVLLAGDAAHVHYPAGGQGLGLGLQDAVNLGWKLARVVQGRAPDGLLDTYHDERHPVGARALQYSMALGQLQRRDPRMEALAGVVSGLAAMDEPRRSLGAAISGLDIHYDLGPGHPLLGRRMPDLDLETADGPIRVFDLLHRAGSVLLSLGGLGHVDLSHWPGPVESVRASCAGVLDLPVLGPVEAPGAVLVRPDGYVAWVAAPTEKPLTAYGRTAAGP